MYSIKLYNSYNDSNFIFNTCIGNISSWSFCIGIFNLAISASNLIPQNDKEICKVLISTFDYA